MARRRVATFSRGMAAIPGLAAFLDADEVVLAPEGPEGLCAVAGWGLKANTAPARAFAARHGLPYLTMEDGFLRSATGRDGAPMSVVVDDLGAYYDASRPSRLEEILASHPFEEDGALMGRARHCLDYFLAIGVSKYNGAAAAWDGPAPSGRRRVLVLGQVEDDLSILHGCAEPLTNLDAVARAADENPGADILFKPHPDVASGRRRALSDPEAIARIALPVPPGVPLADAVRRADHVYTITSLGGFESLLRGVPVTALGCPFYAGWGITDDRQPCPRRTRRLTAEQVFAAAYLLYPRYRDPYTGGRCGLERVLDAAEAMLRARRENAAPSVCLGISPWKRQAVGDFLGAPGAKVSFLPTASAAKAVRRARRSGARVVQWASAEAPGLEEACRAAGVPLARMEDGFLRSSGLGVRLHRPGSLAVDALGIHYDPARPSALEDILENGDIPAWAVARAARLRERLVAEGVGKYGKAAGADPWPARDGRRRVLVVGQVGDDASVRLGSPEVPGNLELLERVRAENPGALVAYKPHPDVVAGLRLGAVPAERLAALADAVLDAADAADAIRGADEVHVMTSGLGLEALLAGRRVVAHGLPFYAGWGLTTDRMAVPRRTRRRSLDELAAAAYLLYPRYVDPVSRLPCGPEVVIERIVALEAWPRAPRALRLGVRLKRLWHGAAAALARAAGARR